MMKAFIAMVFVIAFSGCAFSGPDTAALVEKYSTPPDQGHWCLIADTQEFWNDVHALHRASLRGDPGAMRTILLIGTFTDGAVSEGMPDLSLVVRKHPKIARQVILGDKRLTNQYSHWVD